MLSHEVKSATTSLLSLIEQLAAQAGSLKSFEEGIVEAISQRLPYYDWIGFCMLDPKDAETPVLGPFLGEPTPHVRIPVNQGISGAACIASSP